MSRSAELLIRPNNPYQPHKPTPKQRAALFAARHYREVFFGGAAGGGKSDLLLHFILEPVHIPSYRGLIVRRTFSQLTKADGLVERSHEWLGPTDARWKGDERKWVFPSGASIEFGHCEHAKNIHDYQGAAFHRIGFDELTQFQIRMYLYIGFSRARRLIGGVPLCTLSTSNPGGESHKEVNARFACAPSLTLPPEHAAKRIFIPSKLTDNPHLEQDEYAEGLRELDPVTRDRLLDGDWTVSESGEFFKSHWFNVVDRAPASDSMPVRYWDLAATTPHPNNPDPDWTRGCLLQPNGERVSILDYRSIRAEPAQVRQFVLQTAKIDGPGVQIVFEQEGGSSGKDAALTMRNLLRGYPVKSDRVTGSKTSRAVAFAHAANDGLVDLVNGSWVADFLAEADAFGTGAGHDDMIDAATGAFNAATRTWGWDQVIRKKSAA